MFGIGEPIALQAAVILYPETMAGSIAVALLSGLESIAKPSIGQIADQVVAAGGSADQTIMIDTKYGYVAINLRADLAPKHTMRLTELTREGFYDGIVFHRVIEGFMAQTGDPTGTGTGGESVYEEGGPEGAGPKGMFKDEFNGRLRFIHRGLVGMASHGPNTNGSQFFITEIPTPWLDGKHAVFGKVISGGDLVPKIARMANAEVRLDSVEIYRA